MLLQNRHTTILTANHRTSGMDSASLITSAAEGLRRFFPRFLGLGEWRGDRPIKGGMGID